MEAAGQVVITGISGLTLTDEEKTFIENEKVGGVILFAHNYENPAQLADLVNNIQLLRDEYPLFISVDHEGGRVQRFKSHFTHFPAMKDFASLNSPKLCYEIHRIMAEELQVCGVNLNFSPVTDILTNPHNKVIGDRAFGTDADSVSKFISAAIRGLQTNGMMACAKHFPGHGSTTKDSHFDLPIIKTPLNKLSDLDLIPFMKAAKSRVEFMMVAHMIVDCFDEELPTSLSKKVYDYIRKELKYTKIIVTDDMEMKAVADRFSIEESSVMALNAGADMLIYRSMESSVLAIESIKQALKTKKILNDDFSEKLNRINSCKKQYLSEYRPIYIPGIADKINKKTTQALLGEINDRLGI